jgi:hypothetical protein
MSLIKPLVYGLLGLGFVRESRQVRQDFPDEAGEVYSWAVLAAAGAVTTRPTEIARAIDTATGVDGLGYIVCDELLTASFLGLYQFTRQESGTWKGLPRTLATLGWLLIPAKVALWAGAKQEARNGDDVEMFYNGYSDKPAAAGRMRLVVASSMLYNALLAGAGFLTMPARTANERAKWRIATGVFGLASAYAGVRLRQLLSSGRGGDPREGSNLLVPITIASAGAALVGLAIRRQDKAA